MHDWQGLDLADPRFGHPRAVDLLLGAGFYHSFLRPELLRRNEMMPRVLRHFPLDETCKLIFACHQRTSKGRYIVRLSVKPEGLEMLGESLNVALASLSSLHRRLSQDVEMAKAYICLMTEYAQLGYMRPIPPPKLRSDAHSTYYIPHHGIWQRGDHHRRLGVVFNVSRPTFTVYSLNDILHTGPTLNTTLGHMLIRWRRHRIAFSADVGIMYRQILVNEQDVDL
ncbi:uncharacterized protein LOC117173581 [Belonocnema kinseyi]|uniref:uncharacterized protein LOC117173581 n=1 Tax=Belonocnema kinseyi TaxID=2817044 RepID=UPI00143D94CC|nr:uncharacterized protein LOC117173581 [Belonocnema kinseyi]